MPGENQPFQPTNRHIPRRAIVMSLAGLTGVSAVGGGLFWLISSHKPQASPSSFHPRVISSPTPSPISTPVFKTLGPPLLTYHDPSNDVIEAVGWSSDGRHIASTGANTDLTVQVWDASTGNIVLTHPGSWTLAWSPNGKLIASAYSRYDATLQTEVDVRAEVWDASTGNTVSIYSGHSDDINVGSIAWSPDGKRIASIGWIKEHTVQVWDVATGKNIFIYRGHSWIVGQVSWSPDSKHIASVGTNGDFTVRVWDANTGIDVLVFPGHRVTWSPDGGYIASVAISDNTIQIWDINSKANVYTYNGHTDSVYNLAWSPDGKRIASASSKYDNNLKKTVDVVVQVWDVPSMNHIYLYHGHTDYVTALTWSLDSKYIASSSWDRTVQVWLAS